MQLAMGYAVDEYDGFFFGGAGMTDELQRRLQHKQAVRLQYGFVIGLVVMIVAFGTYFLSQREDVQKSYLYPYPYKEVVMKYSERYGVDNALVAAVIKTESKFRMEVTSDRGAIGLMQLMPDTARWISEQIEDNGVALRTEKIRDPEINVRYGTWYLSTLMREFEGNEVLALAAYNAGIGNVREWMVQYGWNYDFRDADAIPFKETREYVKSVQKSKIKYKALYEH